MMALEPPVEGNPMTDIRLLELATAALAVWSEALDGAATRPGPRQRELQDAATAARTALAALAAGDAVQACFSARLDVASAEAGEAYYVHTRCWELGITDDRVRFARWMNHATQVGARQSAEIDVTGDLDEQVPELLNDWGATLSQALESAAVRLGGRCEPRIPPCGDPESPDAAPMPNGRS